MVFGKAVIEKREQVFEACGEILGTESLARTAKRERGERIGAGPVLRAWRGLLVFASRWFQIESLYKFNAKFCPAWEPRFFVYPGTRDTPRIAIAALEAEAFLVWPRLEVKRYARRLARALSLGGLRARAAVRH